MKKILNFVILCALGIGNANAAVRDGNTTPRKGAAQQIQPQRLISTRQNERTTGRATALNPSTRAIQSRNTESNSARVAARPVATSARTAIARTATTTSKQPRSGRQIKSKANTNITARAATNTDASVAPQTRIGTAYDQCKNAYFECMDQFCTLKNDKYRRCSCSNRVYAMQETLDTLQQASTKLHTFTENLDIVGMTANQVNAMHTASEGENALTSDKSASKALLQAIINSIRGDDSYVGGKYSDLNSINMSFDTANAFGISDSGQVIATYNGQQLYSTVYPECRKVVADVCNDASLQRAVTAYLMAIEQDCNTLQTAIESQQKDLKSAVREGNAMLDLARVENRQKHNSSDLTACVNNIETAITSEEVCGANYHKCLDNGEFIDITTGKPITGIENFYQLEQMLTFANGVDAAYQKLSQIPKNATFIKNFEAKTKMFATDALDKCTENANDVWSEYLDRALLAIYYAQKAKVETVKQECFDYIAECFNNAEQSITGIMSSVTDPTSILMQPNKVALTTEMCQDHILSCNNMFGENIVSEYVNNRTDTDVKSTCRAVAKQCFTSFGSTQYQNFYYPYSGLFQSGHALDWFTLYDYSDDLDNVPTIKSECAKQLASIEACNTPDILETVFGGFDTYMPTGQPQQYGTTQGGNFADRIPRQTGIATEVYNTILTYLTNECYNTYNGRFIPGNPSETACYTQDLQISNYYIPWATGYNNENICPRDYNINVDIQSWGICSCWENGGRRSNNGTSINCVATVPFRKPTLEELADDPTPNIQITQSHVVANSNTYTDNNNDTHTILWYPTKVKTSTNQVCSNGDIYQQQDQLNVYKTQGACDSMDIPMQVPQGIMN